MTRARILLLEVVWDGATNRILSSPVRHSQLARLPGRERARLRDLPCCGETRTPSTLSATARLQAMMDGEGKRRGRSCPMYEKWMDLTRKICWIYPEDVRRAGEHPAPFQGCSPRAKMSPRTRSSPDPSDTP